MHQLIYTSQATITFSDDDLLTLLRRARRWNEQYAITGVLLYGNDQFLQVLEGPEAALNSLYEHLVRDLRHHSIMRLATIEIAERSFAQWSMAFHAAAPEQLAQVIGYFKPEQLVQHYQHRPIAHADELLTDLIQGFVHLPFSKL